MVPIKMLEGLLRELMEIDQLTKKQRASSR